MIIVYNTVPKCTSCGKNMKEWNPFSEKHEHIECIADRISNKLVNKLREQLKNDL